jgi:putative endonuclease
MSSLPSFFSLFISQSKNKPSFFNKAEIGAYGESIAAGFLHTKGIKIIERNYKPKRWGEIDLIGLDDNQLIIIEVKTRVGEQMTDPTESIHSTKINALVRAAYSYQKEHPDVPEAVRIDVVTIELDFDLDCEEITHYENIHASMGPFSKRV